MFPTVFARAFVKSLVTLSAKTQSIRPFARQVFAINRAETLSQPVTFMIFEKTSAVDIFVQNDLIKKQEYRRFQKLNRTKYGLNFFLSSLPILAFSRFAKQLGFRHFFENLTFV